MHTKREMEGNFLNLHEPQKPNYYLDQVKAAQTQSLKETIMDTQVQLALIAALASLGGVLVGAIPTYLIARAQHKHDIERELLRWRKEYREKMLARVDDVLSKRANAIQVNPNLHVAGVFDPELAKIMRRIAVTTPVPEDLILQAYQRMEQLITDLG